MAIQGKVLFFHEIFAETRRKVEDAVTVFGLSETPSLVAVSWARGSMLLRTQHHPRGGRAAGGG